MDKPSKLERWLTIVANLAVVAGIVFLGLEMRQNTEMMRAQIRDSITDKQMEYLGWLATSDLASAVTTTDSVGIANVDATERRQFTAYAAGQFREWENSHYQFEQGLFTAQEFEARSEIWPIILSSNPGGYGAVWAIFRASFSPRFRAEIDAILAEIEN